MEEIIKEIEKQIEKHRNDVNNFCTPDWLSECIVKIPVNQAKQIVEALKRVESLESRFDGRFG